MCGLSLVVASRGHSSSWWAGLSLSRPLLLRSTGSRCAGSAAVAHGPSCSAAYGIFPDQGSNPCPLHHQADSQPLCHRGSPRLPYFLPNILLLSQDPNQDSTFNLVIPCYNFLGSSWLWQFFRLLVFEDFDSLGSCVLSFTLGLQMLLLL